MLRAMEAWPSVLAGVIWGAWAFLLAVGRHWWPRAIRWVSIIGAVVMFVGLLLLIGLRVPMAGLAQHVDVVRIVVSAALTVGVLAVVTELTVGMP
ncbi:MAG: hypothetical protein JNJ54_05440 [Myxococcaceae bacterium]|nr:hypothetical protein [Myxococcaceae bacterium]